MSGGGDAEWSCHNVGPMERHKLTDDQAFEVLIQASQHSNTKLRDVAAQLVHSGLDPQA